MAPNSRKRRRGCSAVGLLLALGVLSAVPATGADTAVIHRDAKAPAVTLEPAGYGRVVVLLSRHNEYKYYSFDPAQPLSLRVTGPTTLALLIRLLYDQTMKGTQEFSVHVQEEGLLGAWKEVGVYALKAHKSTVATLKGEASLVPARGEKLDLAVPAGQHAYRLTIAATGSAGAIARVSMPKKDLGAGGGPDGGGE